MTANFGFVAQRLSLPVDAIMEARERLAEIDILYPTQFNLWIVPKHFGQ
jgi:hypothetical protein